MHLQGTDLSGNTITNCSINNSYISGANYNLRAEYFNGLSTNNSQLEDCYTAGAYLISGNTAVFTGGSIESAQTGAIGITMDANQYAVIALCDFFNNAGGNFISNGKVGHFYKTYNSGLIFTPGAELRLEKDATYTSLLRFVYSGVTDVSLRAGSSAQTLGFYDSGGNEDFSFDGTNNVFNILQSNGKLRLWSGAQIRFYQGGIDYIWMVGSGSPEGVVTAPPGSLYTNSSGGASTTLYVKESGTGNTGWIAK